MTQPTTSIQSFDSEVASGRLQSKRQRITEAFKVYGPGTSNEVLTAAGFISNLNLSRARVVDAVNDGVLEEQGVRRCKISGRKAMVLKYVGVHGKPRKRAATLLDWKVFAAEACAAITDPEARRAYFEKMQELITRKGV